MSTGDGNGAVGRTFAGLVTETLKTGAMRGEYCVMSPGSARETTNLTSKMIRLGCGDCVFAAEGSSRSTSVRVRSWPSMTRHDANGHTIMVVGVEGKHPVGNELSAANEL